MTLVEAMRDGIDAYRQGAAWHSGGFFPVDTPLERAWRAGWEAACADSIEAGAEPRHAMPSGTLLRLCEGS